ncbi:MAG: hypothetical protein M1830_004958 [Pleopsidium flavum]|nr:MAG: hypothetical protein M1830_004958 [Pleopsidium flavum]
MKMKSHTTLLSIFAVSALAKLHEKADTTIGTYSLVATIPWSPITPSSVDQSVIYNGTYYLSDRSNAGIHVVSTSNNTQTTLITGFATNFVNKSLSPSTSGPNGLVVLPDRNEVYAGDGDGTIKVVDLFTNKVTANISTGSKKRADEFAYDPSSGIVVCTNPNEATPYVTVISAANRTVMGKVSFPNATELEQPAFNPDTKEFYLSVPSIPGNIGGEIAVLNLNNLTISRTYPVPDCAPAGIVFGPKGKLFIGCSESQIEDYGFATSYIMDVSSGNITSNITYISGVDQVAYSPFTKYFYASAYQDLTNGSRTGAPAPVLAVVGSNGTLIQSITTDNVTAHSVAVDSKSGVMVIPVKAKGILLYGLGSSGATNSSSGDKTPTTSGGTVISTTSSGRKEMMSRSVFAAALLSAALWLL